MALFSDGPPSTVDDLTSQDSFLLGVASTEGIDVTTKLSLAYTELTVELNAIFAREASIYAPVLGEAPLDTNHLSVTPTLAAWHSFRALELVYRDAYFNQLNDRYKNKWLEFQNLGRWAMGRFIDTGAGLIIDPIPMPATPVVSFQTASQSGGTVYLSVTFLNSTSQESSPSVTTDSEIPDGNVLMISAPAWPSNVVAWNAYVGSTPTGLIRQNGAPLVLGQSLQFLLPGAQSGAAPGTGQVADVTRDIPRRIMRG